MSLYLKYRPKLIEELDLTAVRKTLGDVVKSGKVAHAYLFTGPRGAGKTSAARILARVVNCEKNDKKLNEPCNECEACMSILNGSAVDVVEIDAASNRGIDDIRELREKIRLAPAILRKKVYIIDEVHMLTTEAFNALLKTLEEPPPHAMFILCTTETHKVPGTIASRCVGVKFTKASQEEMIRSFARVTKGEGVSVNEEALILLASSVDGSFRDGVKILETLIANNNDITLEMTAQVFAGTGGYKSRSLAEKLASKDMQGAISEFQAAIAEGADLTHVITSVMKELRESLLASYGIEGNNLGVEVDKDIIKLIYKLDEVVRKASLSNVPELLVEMVIVEWCDTARVKKKNSGSERGGSTVKEIKRVSKVIKEVDEKEEEKVDTSLSGEAVELSDPGEAWGKILKELSSEGYSLGALISKAAPGMIRGDTLTIKVAHDFHKEQLMQEKFRSKVEKAVTRVVGRKMRIECVTGEVKILQKSGTIDSIAEVSPGDNELVEAAEEIFGN